MNETEKPSIQTSEVENSGESGAPKPDVPSAPISTANLPDAPPTIPQKVKFFTARDTFLAENFIADLLPITLISAIKFDAFIAPLFKDIVGIDREKWELADKLWAVNSALGQYEQRRKKGQVHLRLDPSPEGKFILSIVYPEAKPAAKEEVA